MSNENRSSAKQAARSQLLHRLTQLIDLLWLSIIFFVTCIPIITIGPAVTALYYTVVKVIRRERGKLAESYFSSFRSNFRQGLILWLICLAYLSIGLVDVFLLHIFTGSGSGGAAGVLQAVSWLYLLPLILFLPWLFAYLSRFTDTIGKTLKNTAYLALRNLGTTIGLAVLLAAGILLGRLLPVLIPILPGPVCILMSRPIEKVFRTITQQQPTEHGTDDWYNE